MDLHRRFYDFVRGGEVFWLRKLLRGVSCCAGQPKPWRWRGRRAMVRFHGQILWKETSTGNSGNLGFPHQHIGGSCNFFNDLHMAPDSAAF